MNNIKNFSSRKEVTEFLSTKCIDTSNWSEEKWLSINKGQAEIHIMDLAEKIYDAMNESTPKQLEVGQCHIPFGDNIKEHLLLESFGCLTPTEIEETKVKIAVARCARLSYETLGDNPVIDYKKDIKLHDDLLAMRHFSPFEHCCVVPSEQEYNEARKGKEIGWFYNLKGFKSYRFSLDNL